MVAPAPGKSPRKEASLPAPLAAFYSRPRPHWLVEDSLSANRWTIQLEDPTLRRNALISIPFDVPVAPGISLLDKTQWRDLLTAKLYIYLALTGRNSFIRTSTSLREEYAGLLTFLRWRNERGIHKTTLLTKAWFSEFCESLTLDGLEGLLKTEVNALKFVTSARERGLSPPSQLSSKNSLSMNACARLIGLDSVHQLSPKALEHFACWGKEHGLGFHTALKRRLGQPVLKARSLALDRYFRVWERLGRMHDSMGHDPINYRPFACRQDSIRLARSFGALRQRTRTIPAQQACFLIDRALRWVLFYADDLIEIAELAAAEIKRDGQIVGSAAEARVIADQACAPGLRYLSSPSLPALPDLRQDGTGKRCEPLLAVSRTYTNLLPAACIIVIAAFSARRREELLSLKDDCLETIDGEVWLKTYIVKSLRGRERIPVPDAVRKAVEILQWLSRSARAHTGTDWLVQFETPVLSKPSRTLKPALDRLLNSFAGMVGMPPLPDGSQWSFTPHQLRRFFAITYYYRFRDRSLTALSHYLRHNNPDSTRTYITEAKMGGLLKMVDQAKADMERARRAHRSEQTRQREFEEVGLDFRVEIFQGALAGTETLAGWAGARMFDELKRLRNEWDRRLEVGDFGADAPTLDDLITEFARSQVLEPNGQGHSYCACTGSEKDTSVAACALEGRQREGIGSTRLGPDLRFAADLTCSSCPHNVQLKENREYWEGLVRELATSCNQCPGTILAQQLSARYSAATEHLKRCHP